MRDHVGGLPAQGWITYAPGGDAIEFAWDEEMTGSIALSKFDDSCDGMSPIPWCYTAG